jgi:hypothetical protein
MTIGRKKMRQITNTFLKVVIDLQLRATFITANFCTLIKIYTVLMHSIKNNFAALFLIAAISFLPLNICAQQVAHLKSIYELKAYSKPIDVSLAYLSGYEVDNDGGGGMFEWLGATSKNLSTVTAGYGYIDVAPAVQKGSSTGFWHRVINDVPINIKWFGANENNKNNEVAIMRAIDYATDNSSFSKSTTSQVFIPRGVFPISNTIHVYKDVAIIGEGYYLFTAGKSEIKLVKDIDAPCFFIHSNTASNIAARPVNYNNHFIMRDIAISAANGYVPHVRSDKPLQDGLYANVEVTLERVSVTSCKGNGISLRGSAADHTDVSGSHVKECIVAAVGKNGFNISGPDANGIIITGCDSRDNCLFGFNDEGFLGNTFIECVTQANGVLGPDAKGNLTGGSYRCSDGNSKSMFLACYAELDQNPVQSAVSNLFIGGQIGTENSGQVSSDRGNVIIQPGWVTKVFDPKESKPYQFVGGGHGLGLLTMGTDAFSTYSFGVNQGAAMVGFKHNSFNDGTVWVTPTNTTPAAAFGRSQIPAQFPAFIPHSGLFLSTWNYGNDSRSSGTAGWKGYRQLGYTEYKPAAGNYAVGDLLINTGAVSDKNIIGWRCIQNTGTTKWQELRSENSVAEKITTTTSTAKVITSIPVEQGEILNLDVSIFGKDASGNVIISSGNIKAKNISGAVTILNQPKSAVDSYTDGPLNAASWNATAGSGSVK